MKVFMIGGTGLLGSAAAQLFIDEGHSVISLALPPLPEGAPIPKEMELVYGNYLDMSDDEIKKYMSGCDCFVFAAGIDERVEFPAPVYSAYKKYNIKPVRRLIKLSKESGITKSVILGSYFTYFAKNFPEMRLALKHPYIRSRVEQERVALSLADDKMDVAVLELPYIFGVQPGRRPVWTILIEQLERMGKVTMYPRGGTTMVTVRQVAQATVGAALHNKGANAYPIGYYNLTWNEFLAIVHSAMGVPDKKIVNIPKWMFKAFGIYMKKDYAKRGIEPGLDTIALADIMCMETFIDNKWCKQLGVTDDNIERAIYDSVKLSVEAYKNASVFIDMKAK